MKSLPNNHIKITDYSLQQENETESIRHTHLTQPTTTRFFSLSFYSFFSHFRSGIQKTPQRATDYKPNGRIRDMCLEHECPEVEV